MRSQYAARTIIRRDIMLEELTRHSIARRPHVARRLWARLMAKIQRSRLAT